MKILYTTDLHGRDAYYNVIQKEALKRKVDMVINGGDMLPKMDPLVKRQEKYINWLGKRYFPIFEKAGIHYLCCLGNDDLGIFDELFDEVCKNFEYVHNIAGRRVQIHEFEFIGFNLVADYPFPIKDRCRMDSREYIFPPQYGIGCLSHDTGLENIGNSPEDWFAMAKTIPTLEDELKKLPLPDRMNNAVCVMHMPPASLGLDICAHDQRASSQSVYSFLAEHQPMLSLHGHVHESYKMSGVWKAAIGRTICVQPGQDGPQPVFVVIDTKRLHALERFGHDTELLMVDTYALDGQDRAIVRLEEMPDYLIKPFKKWNSDHGLPENAGSFPEGGVNAKRFKAFCDEKGIKIKLIIHRQDT